MTLEIYRRDAHFEVSIPSRRNASRDGIHYDRQVHVQVGDSLQRGPRQVNWSTASAGRAHHLSWPFTGQVEALRHAAAVLEERAVALLREFE